MSVETKHVQAQRQENKAHQWVVKKNAVQNHKHKKGTGKQTIPVSQAMKGQPGSTGTDLLFL